MKMLWAALAGLYLAAALGAEGPDKPEHPSSPQTKSFQVPYRLTKVKHILVRAKINGKGPYNFLVDTGAPALFVAVPVARKLGIKPDNKDWGILDRFEIEGGVDLNKIKGRIETP